MIRVGNGYDAHRLSCGRDLIIGGVHIPHESGLFGHSDADVLVHAVIDSLLGAAALGNIGERFPDSDEKYKGACSMDLLRETLCVIAEKGFVVLNVDSVVVAQEPRLAPFTDKMRENIAEALKIDKICVSVKGKTEEGMGFTGRKEGIKAYAACLIESQ